VFWIILFNVDRKDYFEIVNSTGVALAVGVVIAFGPGAWRALQKAPRDQTAGDVLITGIFILWSGILLSLIFLWLYRISGTQGWVRITQLIHAEWLQHVDWLNGWSTALSRWIILLGGILHLSASGAIEKRVPARAYVYAGVVAALGVGVAMFLISFGID
jgi:hypothetical protein